MTEQPRVSIVVNNYNYDRFLGEAIDSALAQTYPRVEVVVVDDGSTDRSREIIEGYGDRIRPVLKENGGQASAFNAGFEASEGDFLIFLDADDLLLPPATEAAVSQLTPGCVKVHWPLWEVDGAGRRLGGVVPRDRLGSGDLREQAIEAGPAGTVNPPTSGNLWSRAFLERVLPVPEDQYRIWADVYLLELAPLLGPIGRVEEPLGQYRLHGANRYAGRPFEERLERGTDLYGHVCRSMAEYSGIPAEHWRERSWFHRLERALNQMERVIPPGATFALLDEDEWGTDGTVRGRKRLPFPEREGVYWGRPADDTEAEAALDHAAQQGGEFLVVAWPAFWWLDYYEVLAARLRNLPVVFESDLIRVFELASGAGGLISRNRSHPAILVGTGGHVDE